MTRAFPLKTPPRTLLLWLVPPATWLVCAYLGYHASLQWLLIPSAIVATLILIKWPGLGFYAVMVCALLVPMTIGTGTGVDANPTVILIAGVLGVWLFLMIKHPNLRLRPSRLNRPMALFLVAGLASTAIGTVLWDPSVPRGNNFLLVQFAQWAIWAFSAGAMWLTGILVRDEAGLRRLTFFFLALAGVLAIALAILGDRLTIGTYALHRAPFWILVTALALGQLLFNCQLAPRWRAFALAVCAAVVVFVFFGQRDRTSYLVGVASTGGFLVWLKWARWRGLLIVSAIVCGFAFRSQLYEFAGGDSKWEESGGSRLVLINRVIEVTARNPITGIGPAAYRPYARMQPLPYGNIYWPEPLVNSHNNYVDLYSQLGVVGLALFAWFAIELVLLALRVRSRFRDGFALAYASSMLALWIGSLAIMAFADWILPFVYNIGFLGFQASILVWIFLGGLISLDRLETRSIAR
jgi:O-antigen ligase